LMTPGSFNYARPSAPVTERGVTGAADVIVPCRGVSARVAFDRHGRGGGN
jgi:hypothetical protein